MRSVIEWTPGILVLVGVIGFGYAFIAAKPFPMWALWMVVIGFVWGVFIPGPGERPRAE